MFTMFLGFRLSFFGRFGAGLFDGGVSTVKETLFSNSEITIADNIRKQIVKSEPWTNHISMKGLYKLAKALKAENSVKAKIIVEKYKTETNAPWCIDAMKSAIVLMCTKCPDLLKEALPTHYF